MDYLYEAHNILKMISELPNCDEKIDLNIKGSYMVMKCIIEENGLYAYQIAKKLNLSRSRLSSLIKNLVSKDFILLKNDESDGRKQRIYPTEKGIIDYNKAGELVLKRLSIILELFGEELTEASKKIIVKLNEYYKGGKICLD